MNYVAFAGWWFAAPTDSTELAALFCSYGLLTTAPDISGAYRKSRGLIGRCFRYIIGG